MAQSDIPLRRRPGAQPANRNRLIHGRRSRVAVQARAARAAGLKAAALLLAAVGALPGRLRHRPLRPAQMAHLDAEAVRLVRVLGVPIRA